MDNQSISSERFYKRYISTIYGMMHEDTFKEFSAYNRYFVKNYLKFLPADKSAKILDIGCGMGHFLYFLKDKGYKNYIGVDIGDECIEFCKKKGFNVKNDDALAFLSGNKERFDIIVMNDTIEHFCKEEVITIMDLVHKNLTIDGKVIVKTINCSNPIVGSSSRYHDFTHQTGFTEVSLSQVLAVCGFKEIKIYPQDIFIFWFNPINYIAKFFNYVLSIVFRLLFLLYGRKSTKIFTKAIIGVGVKA